MTKALVKHKVGDIDFGKKSVPFWDYVGNCKCERCGVFEQCTYEKNRGVKCGMGMAYFGKLEKIVMDNVDKLSRGQLFRIGTNLLPLYQMYFKLKMKELEYDDVLNEYGNLNTVYMAIANLAEKIEKMWKSTGLADADIGVMEELQSQSNYYETLEDEE